MVSNKPLLLFLATFATGGLSTGMAFGMLYFFVDAHLSLGGTLALLFVLGAPIGAAAMPFWAWLAKRIGKQRTWAAAYTASACFLLLHLLIPAGPSGEPWLIAAFVMVFLVSSVGVVVPAALLADIVDYGRWKYKADYAGSYFAIQTTVEKGVEGLGVAGRTRDRELVRIRPAAGAANRSRYARVTHRISDPAGDSHIYYRTHHLEVPD